MVNKLKPTNAVFLVSKSNMIIKTFPQMLLDQIKSDQSLSRV